MEDYNTICLSIAILVAEFRRFGRCFRQPRPLANLPAPHVLVRLSGTRPRICAYDMSILRQRIELQGLIQQLLRYFDAWLQE